MSVCVYVCTGALSEYVYGCVCALSLPFMRLAMAPAAPAAVNITTTGRELYKGETF